KRNRCSPSPLPSQRQPPRADQRGKRARACPCDCDRRSVATRQRCGSGSLSVTGETGVVATPPVAAAGVDGVSPEPGAAIAIAIPIAVGAPVWVAPEWAGEENVPAKSTPEESTVLEMRSPHEMRSTDEGPAPDEMPAPNEGSAPDEMP